MVKGEGTYYRMEVSRKYGTSYTSWIDQLTLSLSMWLQVLLFFFLTWLVPKLSLCVKEPLLLQEI